MVNCANFEVAGGRPPEGEGPLGDLILICCAFIVGSFPTGVILTRLVTGQDVRTHGSGNIGAANVARAAGVLVGAGVALLDILKGVFPVLLGIFLGYSHLTLAAVGFAAVLGHDFSIFLRLRGGKGVATTIGVALALAPFPTVLVLATWMAVIAVTSISSLASLVALALLPVCIAANAQPPAYVVLALILFVLGVAKHYTNIIRLWQGTEQGFRKRRPVNGA